MEKSDTIVNFKNNFMRKKYISIFQKNRLYYNFSIIFSYLIISSSSIIFASGAYDKGTATGKGRFELSLTINPLGIVPYGQNYGVLSYGINDRYDLVTYYSSHQNGTKSQYFGLLYQFFNDTNIDFATAIGLRYTDNNKNLDLFCPQLLYNYKLPYGFSIGGSVVKVIEVENKIDRGNAIDVTLYSPIKNFKKINKNIDEAYIGIGLFKNTGIDINKDELYLHYSIDVIFGKKS